MSVSELQINKEQNGSTLTVYLTGEVNTITAKDLEEALSSINCQELVLDFENLDYITSAGIRVLLAVNSDLKDSGGTICIINANDEIREIFDVVGLYNTFFKA